MKANDPGPAAQSRRLQSTAAGAKLRIPRLLHQTFATTDLPPKLRDNVERLKSDNPGWEHRLYDDAAIESFILEQYGASMYAAYKRINPVYGAARADLFRYLVVYRLGGVYLDIKSRFLRPIDEVLSGDEGFVVAQWSNRSGQRYEGFGLKDDVADIPGGEFQQWHVIAVPGHPFLRAVISAVVTGIDRYRPWLHGTGKLGVMRLTGPIMYTHTIAPLIETQPCTVVANESVLALEYSIYSGDAHKRVAGAHYSEHRVPVVDLPFRLRIAALFHRIVSRWMRLWRGLGSATTGPSRGGSG